VAPTDVDQGPNDDPDHVMEKALALNIDPDHVLITVLAHVTARNRAYGVLLGIQTHGKGAEIVCSNQVLGRCTHDIRIQRSREVPAEAGQAGRAHAPGADCVPIGFLRDITHDIEARSHGLALQDRDVSGQVIIEAQDKIIYAQGTEGLNDTYLALSMDTPVRTAGPLYMDRLPEERLGCITEAALDGLEAGLDLPAMVVGPIVGDSEFEFRLRVHPAVQGSGFRVQGSGFRVQGSGFRVQGSGFRVQGSG
jgi:hypothetical protein